MAKSFKDSARGKAPSKLNIEVVATGDGTFEIILNQKTVATRVEERWLNDELCGKYGFCGDEFDVIKRQLAQSGKASASRFRGAGSTAPARK